MQLLDCIACPHSLCGSLAKPEGLYYSLSIVANLVAKGISAPLSYFQLRCPHQSSALLSSIQLSYPHLHGVLASGQNPLLSDKRDGNSPQNYTLVVIR